MLVFRANVLVLAVADVVIHLLLLIVLVQGANAIAVVKVRKILRENVSTDDIKLTNYFLVSVRTAQTHIHIKMEQLHGALP